MRDPHTYACLLFYSFFLRFRIINLLRVHSHTHPIPPTAHYPISEVCKQLEVFHKSRLQALSTLPTPQPSSQEPTHLSAWVLGQEAKALRHCCRDLVTENRTLGIFWQMSRPIIWYRSKWKPRRKSTPARMGTNQSLRESSSHHCKRKGRKINTFGNIFLFLEMPGTKKKYKWKDHRIVFLWVTFNFIKTESGKSA